MKHSHQTLIQFFLLGDAALVHDPFDQASQQSISALDLADAKVSLCRDGQVDDAVAQVK